MFLTAACSWFPLSDDRTAWYTQEMDDLSTKIEALRPWIVLGLQQQSGKVIYHLVITNRDLWWFYDGLMGFNGI